MNNKTAVVLGTYNRGDLLSKSLEAYKKIIETTGIHLTVIVMDDGSTDSTLHVCCEYTFVRWIYLGENTGWRDSASYLNNGIKLALHEYKAEYIYITHPEVIPHIKIIKDANSLACDNNTWISAKAYYLNPEQQQWLTENYCNIGFDVRNAPGFYGQGESAEFMGNRDYLPENIEKIDVWHSWIFGGGSRDMWLRFGGLTPFENWGSVDVDLLNRRNIAGIKTVSPHDAICIHQNHDERGTPRDMYKCMAALPFYRTAEDALKPELLKSKQ